MQELIEKYIGYLYAVKRRRWMILFTTMLVCLVGWPLVLNLPDTYEVTAKVQFNTETALKPLLQGLAVDSKQTQKNALLLQKTLLNRQNLEKVARAADLGIDAESAREFDSIVRKLAGNVQIVQLRIPGGGGARMNAWRNDTYSVSARHEDPVKAKLVVEEVLNLFVEGVLGETGKDTRFTQTFLEDQINIYEEKLVAAEEKLKRFKRDNVGVMPQEGQNFYSQIQTEKQQLRSAQLQLEEATKRRNNLQAQIDSLVATASAGTENAGSDPLSVRIRALEKKMDESLLQFTEEHPDVVSIKRMLAELYRKRDMQNNNRSSAKREFVLLENNPVYQETKVAIGQENAQIEALKVRVKLYQKNLDYLTRMIDTIPEVEAELSKLNRDYDVINEHYMGLVKRRESAHISSEESEKLNFNVLETPRVPSRPISPNRPVLISGVLVAGIGLGVGVSILLLQLSPTFSSWKELSKATELPVLGTVSRINMRGEIARERLGYLAFGLLLLMIFAAYSGLIAVQLNIIKF